jgi:flagellar motility protein MotE (MotC chaperone)/soluble cytochrome b562
MVYAQVITPGFIIVVEVEGEFYEVHTDAEGKNIKYVRLDEDGFINLIERFIEDSADEEIIDILVELFLKLDPQLAATIISHLDPEFSAQIIAGLVDRGWKGTIRAAEIINLLEVDKAAQILENVDSQKVAQILSAPLFKIIRLPPVGPPIWALENKKDLIDIYGALTIISPEKAAQILSLMNPQKSAEVLSVMDSRNAAFIVRAMLYQQGVDKVAQILGLMDAEVVAWIMTAEDIIHIWIIDELRKGPWDVRDILSIKDCAEILRAMIEEGNIDKVKSVLKAMEKINPEKADKIREILGLEEHWWDGMTLPEMVDYLERLVDEGEIEEAASALTELAEHDINLAALVVKGLDIGDCIDIFIAMDDVGRVVDILIALEEIEPHKMEAIFIELVGRDYLDAKAASQIIDRVSIERATSLIRVLLHTKGVEFVAEILYQICIHGGSRASELLDAIVDVEGLEWASQIIQAMKDFDAGVMIAANILGDSAISEDKVIAIMKVLDKTDSDYVNEIISWLPNCVRSPREEDIAYTRRAITILTALAREEEGNFYENVAERLIDIARNTSLGLHSVIAIMRQWLRDDFPTAIRIIFAFILNWYGYRGA